MSTGSDVEVELRRGLGHAKEGPVHFALAGKNPESAVLLVSKVKIPVTDLAAAKKTARSTQVLDGTCVLVEGELQCTVDGDPEQMLTGVIKKTVKRCTGMVLSVKFMPKALPIPPGKGGSSGKQPTDTDGKKTAPPTQSSYPSAKQWNDRIEQAKATNGLLPAKLKAFDNVLALLSQTEQTLRQDDVITKEQKKLESNVLVAARVKAMHERKAAQTAARRAQVQRDQNATAQRNAITQKTSVLGKAAQEITAGLKNFSIPLDANQLDQIDRDTEADDSTFKKVTTAARIMVSHMADVKQGKTSGESLQTIINKVREEAQKYIDDHKNPHSKVGKARVAQAQALIKQTEAAGNALNEQVRQIQKIATVVEGLTTQNQIDGRGVAALKSLLTHPMLTEKLKASYQDILNRAQAQLTQRATQRMNAPDLTDPDKAQILLECGVTKPPGSKGQSDSFFINDTTGKPSYIFKSVQGEARPSLDIPPGGGTAREILASKLNDILKDQLNLDLGVLDTVAVKLEDESFKQGTKSHATKRTGSLQKAVNLTPGEPIDCKELCETDDKALLAQRVKAIPKDNVDKLVLLDFISLNSDRHANNLLMEGTSNAPVLRPIDAGQMLPSLEFFKESCDSMAPLNGWNDANPSVKTAGQNFLLQLPQAQQPFSDAIKQQIAQMDPDAIIASMKTGYREMVDDANELDNTVEDSSFDLMRKSMKFLKVASQVLTPYQIGRIYADGFQDILAATDDQTLDREIQAVVNAAVAIDAEMKKKNQSEDAVVKLQLNGDPNIVLTTKQKAKILTDKLDLATFQQQHFAELQQSLQDIGNYIADSKEKVTDELTCAFSANIYGKLVTWSKYKLYGGDPKLKRMLAGDDATYQLEVKNVIGTKSRFTMQEAKVLLGLGGYAEMQRLMPPQEFAALKGRPIADQSYAFETFLAQQGT